jgi:hypothetical protein
LRERSRRQQLRSRTLGHERSRDAPTGLERGNQGGMHGHCLCSVFYTARNPEPSASAKRIVDGAMATAGAGDSFRVPADDFVEQAHGPVVRNAALDPRAV